MLDKKEVDEVFFDYLWEMYRIVEAAKFALLVTSRKNTTKKIDDKS